MQGGLPAYSSVRRNQNAYVRKAGSASSAQSPAGISKQLSNAGLKVLGDSQMTPSSMQSGKAPSATGYGGNQKENGGLPPRHPAQGRAQDPTFGGRVPRRDGFAGTNDSVGSLFGGGGGQDSA